MQSPQFSSQFSALQGTLSPTGAFSDIYASLPPQNVQRNSNKHQEQPYVFPDLSNWENLKIPEKIDFLDITNKDLSPGSYCSNIDSILPLENNFNSSYNTRYESQWYNTNNINYGQKLNDFPACAQVNKYTNDPGKPESFCNVQKNSMDIDMYKSCAYYNTDTSFNTSDVHKNKYIIPQNNYINYNSYYSTTENNFYMSNSQIPCVSTLPHTSLDSLGINGGKASYNMNYSDQQTEASNEESDIVVEDSSSDCSEDQNKSLSYENKRCLICNTIYTPLGLQFYLLTSENPLTMSSQTPVIKKVLNLVEKTIPPTKHFLCHICLGLVNAIDHLQLKLDSLYKDLRDKFKKSCLDNNVQYRNLKPSNHGKYSRYKCKICKKIISLKTIFDAHLRNHKTKGYLCEKCGKIIGSYKRLRVHLKLHRNCRVYMIHSYKCSNEQCKKVFRTKSNLKEHENFCLGLLPFKCKNNYCDKKFASATKLKNHMKLKHDKKFIAICSICNIGFVKASDYKSHMVTHSTDKKFSCIKCGKCYKTVSNLNFHLKSHNKSMPFNCSVCKKGFMRKEYLEAHVNNHNGVKNFGCTVCGKKFVSQKNLDAHLKYHDGSVKSNTCNICGKTIISGFEEHLRVHMNFKEFECDLCDMRFNTKNTLAKHKKRKHAGEALKIDES
ncbi:hypothetical protein GWI33_019064 [Rhynchophorus ferrugineus]|uniref:C2H2-type domain-containing protein n=1 Tax=Rhynchophorus ferrugineus TaxID=354439 RepID=A0A834M4J8_RHYFE|nr:hypothetical protein GWI33_019064 [Rhynchophorus ferrugineus]